MAELIICADDFAQSAAIDQGILDLIQRGVLTATSCLTLSPRWQQAALQLTPALRQQADIGLHLDFTQYATQVRHAHPQLVWRSLMRCLPKAAVAANIRAQLDSFEQALGTAPDYIDGHLHVHQLPVIRHCLLEEMQRRYAQFDAAARPWLRISSPPPGSGRKARLIHLLGAQALARTAHAAGFRISPHLLGVYHFQGEVSDYLQHWRVWARQLHALPTAAHLPPVLMCHPARPALSSAADASQVDANQVEANQAMATQAKAAHNDSQQITAADVLDPIAIARVVEWQAMQSPDFMHWLTQAGITPVRGKTASA